jgi:glycosyltransferase involved in cell wall biosynthesis
VTAYLAKRKLFSAVEIAGIRDPDLPSVETTEDGRTIRRFDVNFALREHSRIGRLFSFLSWYAAILRYYFGKDISCVNAHSASVLPLCWLLARLHKCPLIYEPHELESETASARGQAKRAIRFIESTFGKKAAAVICVNRGISEWYERAYKLNHVWSVRNLPSNNQYEPLSAGYFANRFGFAATDYVFLYQGVFGTGRGIELMIEAFRRAPADRQLVFLGFGPLDQRVAKAANEIPNVHFHPAVLPEELLRYTAAADVGMMMIAPISESYHYCYPNKYCECLTVGVPVICTDSLWLNTEVNHYGCGWSTPYEADSLVDVLRTIDRREITKKSDGAQAWSKENNWEQEEKQLDAIYQEVFPSTNGSAR